MNRSRDKGAREERAVVNLHRALNIKAERTLEGGARSDGTPTYDVDLYVFDDSPLIGECKMRANGFKQLYDWLGENDFLTIRTDRKERLYVLPERIWCELIGRLP